MIKENMMEEESYYALKQDLVLTLGKIKKCDEFVNGDWDEEDFIILLSSMINYIGKSSNKDLAREIYFAQHDMHGSFKNLLYKLFYCASENNVARLSFAFPFEYEAFVKYGRENVNTLKQIMEEK